jgi:hypothetical protein
MKKCNLLPIIILGFVLSCKAQSQLQQINTYNTQIIGIWLSVDDPEYKIEFTNQRVQREYINNQLQEETYQYSISSSCGSNSNNGFDIYLKRQSDLDDYACDVINNISTDSNGIVTLSITTERGKLDIYVKQ